MDFRDKTVLVAGMAISGAASTSLLSQLGASSLIVYDSKSKDKLPEESRRVLDNVHAVELLGAQNPPLPAGVDMVVVSPGLPLDLPILVEAKKKGISVISEIELGYRASRADLIAITGTNGKTTTTALTGAIFEAVGRNTFVLGNIGVPITAKALETQAGDVIVAETAALQLDDIKDYHPNACAVLNITEDHQDRYKSMERYTQAKARIFENQTSEDWCVLNYDDPIVRSLAPKVPSKILWFSLEPFDGMEGLYVEDGQVIVRRDGATTPLIAADEVRIPGSHNLQNAMAASALALCQNVSKEVIAQTLREFPGVEHRIETVCESAGVLYINDSKGTNPDATKKAIAAMRRPTVLILGGFDKHLSFDDLMHSLKPRVKHVVVLGETTPQILQAAKESGFDSIEAATTFEEAVQKAADAAFPGDTVLLSPACASWDMFDNFEQRGRRFKELVRNINAQSL